jgi:hypothetical protein
VNLAACFPLAAVKAALSGDDTARKTFLGWIAKDIDAEDVFACIPTTAQEAFRAIYDRQQGNVIDKLNATRDYASARASEITAEASNASLVVKAAEANLEPRPAPQAIAEVRAALAAWHEARSRAASFEAWQRGAPARTEAGQVSAAQRVERETAIAALAQWTAYEATLAAPVLAAVEAPGNMEQMVHAAALLVGHGDQCPACGSTPGFENIEAWRLYYEKSVGEYRAKHAAAQQQHQEAQRAHAQQQQQVREQIVKWQARKHAAEIALAQVSSAATAPVDPQTTVQACDQSIATLTATLEHMLRVDGAWAAMAATTNAASPKEDRAVYDAVSSACRAAAASLLETHVDAFSALVQKHLPTEWVFRLDTENGFAIGYTRGSMHHRALSGAERDALLVAIAMAVAELGGESPDGKKPKRKSRIKQHEARAAAPYQLVIPEDRERRADTLARLMRAWTPYEGQVVLTSTKLPKGGVPKGWTLIDLDAWHEERGTTPGAMSEAGNPETGAAGADDATAGADGPDTTEGASDGQPTLTTDGLLPPPPSLFPGATQAPLPPPPAITVPAPPPAREEWYYHEGTDSYVTLTAEEAASAPDMDHVGDDAAKGAHEQARMDRPTHPEGALVTLGYDAAQIALLPVGSVRRNYLEKNKIPEERVKVTAKDVAVMDDSGSVILRVEA